MARIELRDCTIQIRDGLSGNAVVSANNTSNTNTLNINTVNTNAGNGLLDETVPVGARFTVNSVTPAVTYVVTSANTVNDVTDYVTFTPNLTSNITTNDVLTFAPCRLDVKIGAGNLTWSEKKNYEYLLDRGDLDTVKEGDEAPVEVSLEFVYEHVTTGTGEDITPVDAVKNTGEAADWTSSSDDQCEPYCVDIIVTQTAPCGATQGETLEFNEFRYESLDYDLSAATISVSGKCNVSTINATRA